MLTTTPYRTQLFDNILLTSLLGVVRHWQVVTILSPESLFCRRTTLGPGYLWDKSGTAYYPFSEHTSASQIGNRNNYSRAFSLIFTLSSSQFAQ